MSAMDDVIDNILESDEWCDHVDKLYSYPWLVNYRQKLRAGYEPSDARKKAIEEHMIFNDPEWDDFVRAMNDAVK